MKDSGGVLGPDAEIVRLVLSDLSGVGPQEYIRNEEPDLVLAIGMDALETVENIKGLPIVYVMILDGAGRFSDRENITGVSMVVEPEKQLEIICRAFPDSERIGLLYDPGQSGEIVRRIQEAASGKNTSLVARKVYSPENVPAAFMLIRDEIDVFWMLPDLTVVGPETVRSMFLLAMEAGRPVVSFSEKYVELGALMSIGVDPYDMGRQAGRMAEKILAGKQVASISGRDATKAVITVNTRIAEKLGIVINEKILGRARSIEQVR